MNYFKLALVALLLPSTVLPMHWLKTNWKKTGVAGAVLVAGAGLAYLVYKNYHSNTQALTTFETNALKSKEQLVAEEKVRQEQEAKQMADLTDQYLEDQYLADQYLEKRLKELEKQFKEFKNLGNDIINAHQLFNITYKELYAMYQNKLITVDTQAGIDIWADIVEARNAINNFVHQTFPTDPNFEKAKTITAAQNALRAVRLKIPKLISNLDTYKQQFYKKVRDTYYFGQHRDISNDENITTFDSILVSLKKSKKAIFNS
jgi:hypothetical protein